ncbi:uncharacterized protein LOC143174370 isoform X2 [Nomia melanderi]|uniref:uncharacterized protein LOC143174370 isoform X2 n=1 Tax=Nomia melanderi TaxID=2448451 RepID=UPI003FCDF8AD
MCIPTAIRVLLLSINSFIKNNEGENGGDFLSKLNEKRLNRFRLKSNKSCYVEIEFVYTVDALFLDILDIAKRRMPDEIEAASSPADEFAERLRQGLKRGPLSGSRGSLWAAG